MRRTRSFRSGLYPKSKIRALSLKFEARILMSDVWSLSEVLNLKCEIQSQKSKIRCLMLEVWPRYKVWNKSLTSEVCPKFVWSLSEVGKLSEVCPNWIAITIDLNAGLLILITYIIIYFFGLIIWLHYRPMYVCFCCVTNTLFRVLKAKIRRLK